jgi:hypothetical protein
MRIPVAKTRIAARMSTALALASRPTADGPPAWRASVVTLEPLKREPFDIRLSLTPVWELRSGLINGSTIARHGAPTEAEAADLEEIDVASFAYAAAILEDDGDAEPLRIPVYFVTLATQRARERLLRLTASVRETMRLVAVIEICEIDAVPPSRLMEVAGLVRGLCVGVVAKVRPNRAALESVQGCGLAGVSVEAARLGLEGPDPAARLGAFAAATRSIGADRLVHDLPTSAMVDQAAAAGFSHATVISAPQED